jgi:hypothetical protein
MSQTRSSALVVIVRTVALALALALALAACDSAPTESGGPDGDAGPVPASTMGTPDGSVLDGGVSADAARPDADASADAGADAAPKVLALLEVTAPTAGATWAVDSLHWLTWDGTTKDASFEISLDNGVTWAAADAELVTVYYPQVPRRQLWRVPAAPAGSLRVRAVNPAAALVSPVVHITVVPSQEVTYTWEETTPDTGFLPRDGAALEWFGSSLRLLGGWGGEFANVSVNEIWNSSDATAWSEASSAPWEERHSFGAVQLGSKLFVLGGDAQQGHYQPDVWSTSDTVNWQLVAPNVPWGQRILHYSVAYQNALWVMGGQTLPEFVNQVQPVTYYNDVWRSTDGITWSLVTQHAPWAARGAICGHIVFQNEMWLVGGGTYDTVDVPYRTLYADAWSSSDGVSWKKHADPPWFPRQYHSATVFDGKLFILGGYTWEISSNLTEVWYTADGENWYELKNSPWNERHAASVAATPDALYIGAGGWSDMWRLARPLPPPP